MSNDTGTKGGIRKKSLKLVQRGLKIRLSPNPSDWEAASAKDRNHCVIRTSIAHMDGDILMDNEQIEQASYDCRRGLRIRTNLRHIVAKPTGQANALATAFDQMRAEGQACYFGEEGLLLEFDGYAYPRQIRTLEQRDSQARRTAELREKRKRGEEPPAKARLGARKTYGRAL